MPWREVRMEQERKKFMMLLDDEDCPGVAALCREFGISRKTAYVWIARYRKYGDAGLCERSRAAHSHPNAISQEMEDLIIHARERHPSWGAKKLLPWLKSKHAKRGDWPCLSSVSAILERNQLVRSRKRRRPVADFKGERNMAVAPNDVWCIDHKGWWLARNGEKCEPFTVTDQASRYLVRCVLRRGKTVEDIQPILVSAFHEYGLPVAIRSDNGPPFASRAPLGLSELSVWLMRLGIVHERIQAGKPQQNGRHERMHLTMELDKARDHGASLREEQKRLNAWRQEFNNERPHEALGFATPQACYVASARAMPRKLPPLEYPAQMRVRKVECGGHIYWNGHAVFVTEALRGQHLGLEAIEDRDGVWSLCLGSVCLGHFDERRLKVEWASVAYPR